MQLVAPISIRFYLRTDRKNARRGMPIWVRILLKRKKIELYTYLNVPDEKYWNDASGRIKALPGINASYLNKQIANIEARIYETKDSLVHQGKKVDVENLRLALKETNGSSYGILQYLDDYIAKLKVLNAEYAKGTVASYITTRNHVAAYLKSINKKELSLPDITKVHLVGLEDFLMTVYKNKQYGRSISRNSSNKYLTRLKTALKAAVRRSLIAHSPFEGFKMKYTKTHRRSLTSEEIKKLMEADFVGNLSLQRVRDVFAFSIFTGLRFGDVMALRSSSVTMDENGRYWIKLRQIKTKEEITIPMLDTAKSIFLSYSEYQKATGWALPQITNQKINFYLKIISRALNIAPITFHQARHTFSTEVLLSNQIDLKSVSAWMGHTSLRSTEVYAHVSKHLLADLANQIDKKLAK